ncbi:MAG: CDP-2,3-bis-(O-geranylgeranyl)-sn-glycerol synthase [Euryarchaeota archaeon]|nr:CDP-2,3-bis-(O-geranylgeranyl)-sn-glycerol synthase [Euryarchaeota archaeon]
MGVLKEIIITLWIMLPPYVANGSAVLVGGGVPMDFRKKFIDGRRILGDGKTWRGFFGASLIAGIVLLIQSLIERLIGFHGPYFTDPLHAFFMGISFGLFALLGDLVESFLKRRLGIERGKSVPLADQLDFVISFIFFAYVFYRSWALTWLTPLRVIIAYLITPPLHIMTNIIAYLAGKKEVPW